MSYLGRELPNLLNIFVAPTETFRKLKDSPSIWFPLIILLLAWVVLWNWYYHAVDFSWLINHLIATETSHAAADQREAVTQQISKIKPGALIVISIGVVVVILLAVSVIMSLYLLVVGAIFDDKYRLKHWFSFVVWSSMPSLFAIVAMVVNFFIVGNGQIGAEQLNPLSLNNLLFHVGIDSGYKRLLDGLDLSVIWSWGLMIVGYHEWTQRSWLTSGAVVLVPPALIYGGWAASIAFG